MGKSWVIGIVLLTLTGCGVFWGEEPVLKRGELGEAVKLAYPRAKDVFVVTPGGIYRGDAASRTWRMTHVQEGMPLDGEFFGARGVEDIYYIGSPNNTERRGHVWRFEAGSNSWRSVLEDDGVAQLMVGSRGSVYAITWSGTRLHFKQHILMSRNRGRTWSDITGNIKRSQEMLRDPQDDDRIELLDGRNNNGWYFFTCASDYRYRWIKGRSINVFAYSTTDLGQDVPFRESWMTGASSEWFPVPTTLGDYFEHEGVSWFWGVGIDAVTERPAYRFSLGEPEVVWVDVVLLSKTGSLRLLDDEDERRCWRLQVVEPFRERHSPDEIRGPAASAVVRKRAAVVDHLHPYRREIDLRHLYSLTKPGTYRVRLAYSVMGLAEGETAAWDGGFSGECFTVTITR